VERNWKKVIDAVTDAVRRLWELVRRAGRRVEPDRQTVRIPIHVTGVVHSMGKAEPVFGALVRYTSGPLSTTTDTEGKFSLSLSPVPRGSSQTILILFPDYWPTKVRFLAQDERIDLGNQCALSPVPKFFLENTIGVVLSSFGPKLVHAWYLRTQLEKALLALLVLFLMPPAALFAIDRGLNIPWTYVDENIREQVQRNRWFPSRHPMVRFQKIRPVYHQGVRYQIQAKTYQIDISEVRIEEGSEVTIEPGTTFLMKKGAQIFVKGKLTANGEEDRKIVFKAMDKDAPWGSIAILGEPSIGSSFKHCEIRGGSGRAALGSDTGYFALEAAGRTVGGGLVVFNSTVTVSDTLITECSAVYGGAVYMRNSSGGPAMSEAAAAPTKEFPGSQFLNVTISNCIARGLPTSGGGAVMFKNAFPEFANCRFSGNTASGQYSCGGAMYVGAASRAIIDQCVFERNKSQAEGGGLYCNAVRDSRDENLSGVVVRECVFREN
jgi:hypothetical protein